jgi:hypothetical protein
VDSDEDATCVVERISNFAVLNRVCFAVKRDGRITWQVLAGGHELSMKSWELRVFAGQSIRLWYPFWKRYRVGDVVALSEIAQHPFAPSQRLR